MSLEQGSRVFVAYDLPGPQLFHERLVLAPCACQRGWHVVLTPDGDIYEELLSLKNSDLAAFHLAPPGEDSLPYGVTHANSYRFLRRPPADQMAQLLRDARHAAAAFLLPPAAGAAVAVPAAAPVAPQPAPVAGVDEKRVRIESAGENLRGALVELDGSEVLRGDVGLKLVDGKWIAIRRMKQSDIADFCGAEASADARLLGIKFQGIRREERCVNSKTGGCQVPGPQPGVSGF